MSRDQNRHLETVETPDISWLFQDSQETHTPTHAPTPRPIPLRKTWCRTRPLTQEQIRRKRARDESKCVRDSFRVKQTNSKTLITDIMKGYSTPITKGAPRQEAPDVSLIGDMRGAGDSDSELSLSLQKAEPSREEELATATATEVVEEVFETSWEKMMGAMGIVAVETGGAEPQEAQQMVYGDQQDPLEIATTATTTPPNTSLVGKDSLSSCPQQGGTERLS